jgi:hypothetical protein
MNPSGGSLLLIGDTKRGDKLRSKIRHFYSDSTPLKSEKLLSSSKRIGPHNIDIISIIIGSTLGDTHLEKRQNGLGTRIKFEQSNNNVEYLMWFHNYLASRGYCNPQKPKLRKRIRKNGEIFFHYSINSYTFSSLNWLHDMFYKVNVAIKKSDSDQIKMGPFTQSQIGDISRTASRVCLQRRDNPQTFHCPDYLTNGSISLLNGRSAPFNLQMDNRSYVKIIPENLSEYLTPLALAVWFSNDGSKSDKGAKILTNCFTHGELEFLCDILHKKYNIRASINSAGPDKGEVIYIWTESMPIFSKIVKHHMIPSLHYKLGFN